MPTTSQLLNWAAGCVSLAAFTATAVDWPQYRGSTHAGISTDRITSNWSGSVTNPVWLISLTNGVSSFAVSGGRAFTQGRRDVNGLNKESCIALNAQDGSELWSVTVDESSDGSDGATKG